MRESHNPKNSNIHLVARENKWEGTHKNQVNLGSQTGRNCTSDIGFYNADTFVKKK